MMRLLHIEWNKIFYNTGTRIFIILYFLMILGMGLILPNFHPNLNGVEVNFIKMGALEFPVIWHNLTWLIGFGKFFLAIIIINNLSNEYSFGTMKQNLIDGLSKKEFFGSKVLITFLLTLFSTIFVLVLGLVLGNIYSESKDVFNGIEFVLGYFVEIFAYLSIATFLTIFLKKSAFAILSLIVLSMGESIVKAAEFMLRINVFDKSDQEIEQSSTAIKLFSNYLPFNSNGGIIDYPPISLTNFLTNGKLFTLSELKWDMFGINVFYILLFLGLSLWILKKRDL